MRTWKWLLIGLGVAASAAAVVLVSLFGHYRMPAGSMQPTIAVGQHFLVYRLARTPRRGEVVVYEAPSDPDKEYVKRVVALAGDTVALREDGALVLNGAPVDRRPVPGPCRSSDADEGEARRERACRMFEERLGEVRYRVIHELEGQSLGGEVKPTTVPVGHVFVVGDNRDNSHDSRSHGTVSLEAVRGTVWL